MTAALTNDERAVLLAPCECGHTINDHGSLVACWRCEDEGDECATEFETLLGERVARIVDGRMGEKGCETRSEAAGSDLGAEVARGCIEGNRSPQTGGNQGAA